MILIFPCLHSMITGIYFIIFRKLNLFNLKLNIIFISITEAIESFVINLILLIDYDSYGMTHMLLVIINDKN